MGKERGENEIGRDEEAGVEKERKHEEGKMMGQGM